MHTEDEAGLDATGLESLVHNTLNYHSSDFIRANLENPVWDSVAD